MSDEAEKQPEPSEQEVPWLGTRKFWSVAIALFFATTMTFCVQAKRISAPDAPVAVVSLAGPSELLAGEKARYSVLVRDRWGSAMAHAPVRVGLEHHGFTELGRGETGEGGDAAVEIAVPADFKSENALVAIADVGVGYSRAGMIVQPKAPPIAKLFQSSDKPLYQPGQTIHVRALAMKGDKPLGNRAMVVEIRTNDNIKVFHEEKATSAFGVLSVDFALADQVKLGNYSITVRAAPIKDAPSQDDNLQAMHVVEVKRYSLPKLKVTFEDLETLQPAAPLKGAFRAKWMFGEPVTKGAVRVTLERSGVVERSIAGQLDRDGLYKFELPPRDGVKPSAQPHGTFSLKAKLEVEGGLKADTTTEISTLDRGEIKLEAFPESGDLVGFVESTVFVVASPVGGSAEGIEVWANNGPVAKTDERGIARVIVRPEDPRFDIYARGKNGEKGSVGLYAKKEGLVIRPDHESFAAGAQAHVRVVGAPAGDRIAVRLTKGSEPLLTGTCVVANVKDGCVVPFALPTTTSGLVWIHAMSLPAIKEQSIRSAKRVVMVEGGGRDLTLKVTPDKPSYLPRDVGAIAVDVTGSGGAPVKAELGVAVADEAVFALANVRPDLERLFFVVEQDYQAARKDGRYGSASGPNLPNGWERSMAYDAATPADVRATILAVLSTMPEAAGLPDASTGDVARSARNNADESMTRLGAFAVLAIAAFSLAGMAMFGVYGFMRMRRPLPSALSEEERATFVIETRGLIVDWLVAVFAPIVLAPFALGGSELFFHNSYNSDGIVFGSASAIALLGSILFFRGALRVRRTAIAKNEAVTLGRIVAIIPIATFFAQLAVLLTIDRGGRVRALFDIREASFFVPLVVVLGAQLGFGLFVVVRQTLLREVSRGGRVWLFLSRAFFVGLPITLVLSVALSIKVYKRSKESFAEEQMEERQAEAAPSSSDNKEGGTGTRAKGEEGSMGNPAAPRPGGGARYGVMAPQEDEKKAALGAPAAVRVRDWFPETLLWAPAVVTDDAGKTVIKVPFADSITTWRFALKGVSAAGQLGSASVPLVVKQDFFVDAALPPTLTQGDELAVPVTVYSYLDRAQDVSIDLEGDGMGAVGPAHLAVHLEPKEARGMRFTVRALKAGDRLVRIKASTAARADAQERKVIVVPNGMQVTRTVNKRVFSTAGIPFELPANAIDGGNDLHAKIYGGALSQVGEGLDGVFRMPHGCFEQTSSTTYPSVLVLDFLKRSKAVSPELEKKARGYISQGYQRLVSFEVNGGGFSVFGASPAQVGLSAYGLLELSDMAGVMSVDDALLRRTRDFVLSKRAPNGMWTKTLTDEWDRKKELDDPLLTDYVAWALAASARLDATPDARVKEVLDLVAKDAGPEAEDPYALALRANALLAGSRADAAKPLCEKLAAQAVRDDEGAHWTSKTSGGVMYSYGSSFDIEVTGLATHALALAGLHDDLRAGALDWLVRRRSPYGTWSTTQATIAAMRALLDEARPAPKTPQDVTVMVDGAPAGSITIDPRGRDVMQVVDLKRFATTGKHTVDVKAGDASDISFQLVATHWLPWRVPERVGLGLEVGYGPAAVAPGATTTCRVRLSWRGKRPGVMPLVEVAIPPSFEVDTDELDALVRANNPDGVQRYTVENGKVTLYVTSIREGKPLAFDFRMRAQRSARVVAPASSAYLYYEPEIRAETAPVLIRAL